MSPWAHKGLVAIPLGLLLVHAAWIVAEILADFALQNPLDWSG
jgi:hypothetical protein